MNTTTTHRVRSIAEVVTPVPARYLAQLCKHFQHKLDVAFDSQSGHIVFPLGDCRLTAGDSTLTLSAEADDQEKLAKLQDVVARHLVRFAFREEMQIDWRAA
ncbi:DUF2218 domain-containing protein [Pseudorhodoplanes sinuspersici]|uniref:Uncharacterized protein n=1 Tax=Pseudorhodoplanes sinuspersici TaxID=1235591 RepID=A0A1W6ZYY8_9HYPH|nr:DUF2218 domain-containing protein [Pseudorhodoplanes sinuspersici]ARQ02530.1 hypothetical protein CAK95_28020 [Pseudorhodoplanes sinuspersici]RKE74376.1 hypothetical protein DFP91_2285 [Pseudorhodoplanes sinuspersici]